ncbi:hypothetical protein RJT34_29795 [Clitoria ternatea]|uniref:Uncharacterized protein n=1 Tax=Clitoria ternatea TaxID=43366 RepID=A0AAN9ER98_CLITE
MSAAAAEIGVGHDRGLSSTGMLVTCVEEKGWMQITPNGEERRWMQITEKWKWRPETTLLTWKKPIEQPVFNGSLGFGMV